MTSSQPASSFVNVHDAVQSCHTGRRSKDTLSAHPVNPRDAVTSISSIPEEILLEIFCLVRDAIIVENEKILRSANSPWAVNLASHFNQPKGPVTKQWVQVTHVCSSWRALAIVSGCLWSDMSFLSPRWAHAALERSQESTLTIDHFETQKSPCGAMQNVLGLVHRLRSVRVRAPTKSCLLKLMKRFTGHAPVLQLLWIECDGRNSMDTRLLEGLDAPQLARIHLDRVHIPWKELARCQRVVELDITVGAFGRLLPRPFASTFVTSFEGMASSLRVVDLEACLPREETPADISITPVFLPNLQILRLSDYAVNLTDTLKFIQWPATTLVYIKFRDCEIVKLVEERDDRGDLDLDLLGRFLENFKASVIGFEKNRMGGLAIAESQEMIVHDFFGVRISMHTTTSQESLCRDTPNWSFQYDPDWFDRECDMFRINQAILDAFGFHFGFASIRALLLDNCMMVENQQWDALFGELETIHMSNGCVEGLADALESGSIKLATSAEIFLKLSVPNTYEGCYMMSRVKQMLRRYTQMFRPDLLMEIRDDAFSLESGMGETHFLFTPLNLA